MKRTGLDEETAFVADVPPPLDARLRSAVERIALAHERVACARAELAELEDRVRRARARKVAIEHSLRVSEAAARACDLADSPLTHLSLSRLREALEQAASEVHDLIRSAEPLCAALDGARADLREVRTVEAQTLHAGAELAERANALQRERERRECNAQWEMERPARVQAVQRSRQVWHQAKQEKERAMARDRRPIVKHDLSEIERRRTRPWV